ncbi:MAG: phosphotransferase [Pirellulales bacterium]|nr:phosphotransferase [Pirellulales bacterium]
MASSFPPVVSMRRGPCRWTVLPDWAERLLDDEGLRWAQWRAEGAAHQVKDRAGRAVWRVRLGDRTVFIKHDRRPGLFRAIARRVRGGAALREWRAGLEALRRGLPAAQPVAHGQRSAAGLVWEDYGVIEAVPDALGLDEFVRRVLGPLPPRQQSVLQRRLLTALARLVAQIHEAGVHHGDFHAGNMLVRLDEDGRPRIHLIDLAGARFSAPLPWRASRRDLVVLLGEWFDRTTIAQRWRFWRIYRAARPNLAVPEREDVVRQLDVFARRHSRGIDWGRDRRSLRTNRDFIRLRDRRGTLHAARDLPEALRRRLLDAPGRLLRHPEAEPVKISRSTVLVRATMRVHGQSVRVACKRCRSRTAWKAFCGLFRRSRAVRGWYWGHALLARRIATARPLAACEPTRPRWPRESYLVTEWIDDADNAHLWGWRIADLPPSQRLRRAARAATELGRLLGRMHDRRVSHRDLKAANLLVQEQGDGVRAYLVDLDGVRIHRWLGRRRRAADLARLAASLAAHPWVTPAICWRFLRAYSAEFPRGVIDLKALWRAVARRAARLARRKRRQGKDVL